MLKKRQLQNQTPDNFHSDKVDGIKKEIKNKELELQKIKRQIGALKNQDEFTESVHKIQQLENTLVSRQKLLDDSVKQKLCLEEI